MSDKLVIWHNPRCSKSRQTLQLLKERGHDPVEVNYQSAPPSTDEITDVLNMLGMSARDLMRRGQEIYRELGLANEKDEAKLIEAMHLHPILIERPVVINGNKAALGRPPEDVLKIL